MLAGHFAVHLALVSFLISFVSALPFETNLTATLSKRLDPLIAAAAAKYNCSVSFSAFSHKFDVNLASGSVGPPDKVIPAQPSDRYAWGSVTKTMTGAAIMKLASEGKLSLDDKAADYIDPGLAKENYPYDMVDLFSAGRWAPSSSGGAPNASLIRVRDLIGMQSGVPDYDTDGYRYLQYGHPGVDFSPLDIFSVVHQPLQFTPGQSPNAGHHHGSDFHSNKSYCSVNFILAGYILAHFSNVSTWSQLDQSAILPPSLKDEVSFALHGPCSKYTHVHGIDQGSAFAPYDVSETSCLGGWTAGNVVMSTGAAARWTFALYGPDHQVLPQAWMEQMLPPQGEDWYGLATFNLTGRGNGQTGKYGVAFGHLGDTYGFTSIVVYFPALEISLAIATNLEANHQDVTNDVICSTYNQIRTTMLDLPDDNCTYITGGYYGGSCECKH